MIEWQHIEDYVPRLNGDDYEPMIVTDGEIVWFATFTRHRTTTWVETDEFTKKRQDEFVESWSPYPRRARDIKFVMHLPPPPENRTATKL